MRLSSSLVFEKNEKSTGGVNIILLIEIRRKKINFMNSNTNPITVKLLKGCKTL